MSRYPSKLKNLKVVSHDPINAEIPVPGLSHFITPNDLFFMRNRFAHPDLAAEGWTLTVDGAVRQRCRIDLGQLRDMGERTIAVTLECAGNGRTAFSPPAEGEPWDYGAVSTAWWTGVPLASVLERAGLSEAAVEILTEGADSGSVSDDGKAVHFARSLPLEKALHPDTLLAYAMNGEPLPREHGHPVRLIVPGWYGMASVKWVTHMAALTEPFQGFFQRERYVFSSGGSVEPVTTVRMRSLISSPVDGEALNPGSVIVSGLAWSGVEPVDSVEVSTDGGNTWEVAGWTDEAGPHAWRRWEYEWPAAAGHYAVQSRARAASGAGQPTTAVWNRLGYANNGVQTVRVQVRERPVLQDAGPES
jgi:sulfite oxidase